MDTRASENFSWHETHKEGRLDYIEFHQTGASHNFIAVLAYLDENCNYHQCGSEEADDNYLNQKYSEMNNIVASSNMITVNRNPWDIKIIKTENPYNDEDLDSYMDVKITQGAGKYRGYLVEDSTGKILEVASGLYQEEIGQLFNKNHPDLNWVTGYIAWDYEFDDEEKPTHVSQLKHIIADSKEKKDDYLSLTTSISGLATAGISSAILGSAKYGHKALDFENASFLLGIIGSAFSAATSTINSINKNNLKEEDICK